MYPPIFNAANVPAVQALLKAPKGPLRFWLFGEAPQGVQYPYAVWRTAYGTPENFLAGRPDADNVGTQIDVYASVEQGPSVSRAVAQALRDALETHAYVTSWRGESRDPNTKTWNTSFDVEWIVER